MLCRFWEITPIAEQASGRGSMDCSHPFLLPFSSLSALVDHSGSGCTGHPPPTPLAPCPTDISEGLCIYTFNIYQLERPHLGWINWVTSHYMCLVMWWNCFWLWELIAAKERQYIIGLKVGHLCLGQAVVVNFRRFLSQLLMFIRKLAYSIQAHFSIWFKYRITMNLSFSVSMSKQQNERKLWKV